tara:strand:+ start:1010 stop:1309 length:300 start_codon:yes stop_codon:yes gene_type:complete
MTRVEMFPHPDWECVIGIHQGVPWLFTWERWAKPWEEDVGGNRYYPHHAHPLKGLVKFGKTFAEKEAKSWAKDLGIPFKSIVEIHDATEPFKMEVQDDN